MRIPIIALAIVVVAACTPRDSANADLEAPSLAEGITADDLEARLAQFAPVAIDFDDSTLEPWERQVLARLVEASDIMHELFLMQVSPHNLSWREAKASSEDRLRSLAPANF